MIRKTMMLVSKFAILMLILAVIIKDNDDNN